VNKSTTLIDVRLAPQAAQKRARERLACSDGWITSCGLATFARQNSIRQTTTSRKVKYVPYHRSSVSSYRVHCCIFGAGVIPLGLAKSAGRGAEGFGGRPRYGKFHGSIRQWSGGHLSGGTLRSRRTRSRSSGRIPDVEELDDRLQSDHGLVWTLCQPDNRCRKRDHDIRRSRWPRGKGARHGSFPAHLNEAG